MVPMKLKLKRTTLTVGLAFVLMTPGVSSANMAVIDAAVLGAVTAGTTTVTALLTQILNSINDGFNAVVAASGLQTKAQIASQGDLADATATVDTARTQTQEIVRAVPEYELAPTPELTGGAADGSRLALVGAERIASVFAAQLSDRTLYASSQRNGSAALLSAYQDFIKNYDPRNGSSYPSADVMGQTLLNGAGKPGKASDHTFTPGQIAAAQRFIMNAVNLAPLPALSTSQEKTEAGRRYVAMSRAELAKAGIAQQSFVDALAWKTPVDGLPAKVGSIWQSMSKAITPTGTLTNDLSAEGFLVGEVERRYANPQWYASVAAASPAALQREALFMHALDLRMRLIQIENGRKIELLLAQQALNGQANSPARQEALSLFTQITGQH